MKANKIENYIHDLSYLLKEKAREAKIEKEAAVGNDEKEYKLGYLMALHDVVSLMKDQADAFEINQHTIGLNDIDPE